jgi:hypothetical protein
VPSINDLSKNDLAICSVGQVGGVGLAGIKHWMQRDAFFSQLVSHEVASAVFRADAARCHISL